MNLKGKKIAISGASGGIGSAIAKALSKQGAIVLVSGRSQSKLAELISNLTGDGHQAVVADLLTKVGRKEFIQKCSEFSAEILINTLGVNQLENFFETSDESIDRMVATNLVAPIQLCRDMLTRFKTSSGGIIVNVGSIMGSIGFAGSVVYCATKFGLRGFSESLRRELADTDIRVIYFAPRATDTAINDAAMSDLNLALGNTVDSPDRVAKQLVNVLKRERYGNHYLGWPEAFFVRLNGLLPSLVDKALFKQLPIIRHYMK